MLNKFHEKQQGMELIILEQLVPQDHLLRKIDVVVDYNHIYDMMESLHCEDILSRLFLLYR